MNVTQKCLFLQGSRKKKKKKGEVSSGVALSICKTFFSRKIGSFVWGFYLNLMSKLSFSLWLYKFALAENQGSSVIDDMAQIFLWGASESLARPSQTSVMSSRSTTCNPSEHQREGFKQ